MEIELITFGKITEFINSQRITLVNICNTDELAHFLENKYPPLANIEYKLALNNTIVQQGTLINKGDTVAIMPPFSGG